MFTFKIGKTGVVIGSTDQSDINVMDIWLYTYAVSRIFHGKLVVCPFTGKRAYPVKTKWFVNTSGGVLLHINAFKEFKRWLEVNYPNRLCKTEYISNDWEPSIIDQSMKDFVKPRPYQIPCIEHAVVKREYPCNLMALPPGKGKALTLDTLLLSNYSWIKMGDVEVGDTLIGSDGKPTNVTGVYPQGTTDVYIVKFEDNTQIKASGDHLWDVIANDVRMTVPTEYIMDILNNGKEAFLPLAKPWITDDSSLPLDPYTVGYELIQYDTNTSNDVNTNIHPIFLSSGTNQRAMIFKGMLDSSNNTTDYKGNGFSTTATQLTDLDLPKTYSGSTLFAYITSSREFANDICELCRGLGLAVKLTIKATVYGYDYCITELPNDEVKAIVSIEKTHDAKTQCISVDAPDHLFIAEGYNLTHNTVSSLIAAKEIQHRICIILRPSYMGIWRSAISEFTTASKDEVLSVTGKANLTKLLSGDVSDKRYIIISNKTLQSWVKRITSDDDIIPSNLLEKLDIGLVMFDEVHQDLHFNYIIHAMLNPHRLLGISGTFITEDRKIKKIQNWMYPREYIYDYLRANPYITLVNYNYKTVPHANIKLSNRGMSFYSHNQYEAWIISNHDVKNSYFKMVLDVINISFINRKNDNERAIVYFSRIEFIDMFAEVAKATFPQLKHLVYKQGVDYSELDKHDIIYATPMKASTAADIDKLILIINTISISSIQANVQLICRLRDLTEETGQEMLIVQLINNNIEAHMKYKSKRVHQWGDLLVKTVEVTRDNYL